MEAIEQEIVDKALSQLRKSEDAFRRFVKFIQENKMLVHDKIKPGIEHTAESVPYEVNGETSGQRSDEEYVAGKDPIKSKLATKYDEVLSIESDPAELADGVSDEAPKKQIAKKKVSFGVNLDIVSEVTQKITQKRKKIISTLINNVSTLTNIHEDDIIYIQNQLDRFMQKVNLICIEHTYTIFDYYENALN